MQNKVAIIVGHSKSKQGAYSPYLGLTEWEYHNKVAQSLRGVDLFYRNPYKSTISGIKEVCKEVNKKRYELVISLHFNSFNKKAQGVECLHYSKNKHTESVAELFCEEVAKEFGIKNRGTKPIRSTKENGGTLILGVNSDVILVEPFFGDELQCQKFNIQAYTKFLQNFIDCI